MTSHFMSGTGMINLKILQGLKTSVAHMPHDEHLHGTSDLPTCSSGPAPEGAFFDRWSEMRTARKRFLFVLAVLSAFVYITKIAVYRKAVIVEPVLFVLFAALCFSSRLRESRRAVGVVIVVNHIAFLLTCTSIVAQLENQHTGWRGTGSPNADMVGEASIMFATALSLISTPIIFMVWTVMAGFRADVMVLLGLLMSFGGTSALFCIARNLHPSPAIDTKILTVLWGLMPSFFAAVLLVDNEQRLTLAKKLTFKAELAAHHQLLQQQTASANQQRIVGYIFHEVRNPINNITLASELALDLLMPPKRYSRPLRLTNTNNVHLSNNSSNNNNNNNNSSNNNNHNNNNKLSTSSNSASKANTTNSTNDSPDEASDTNNAGKISSGQSNAVNSNITHMSLDTNHNTNTNTDDHDASIVNVINAPPIDSKNETVAESDTDAHATTTANTNPSLPHAMFPTSPVVSTSIASSTTVISNTTTASTATSTSTATAKSNQPKQSARRTSNDSDAADDPDRYELKLSPSAIAEIREMVEDIHQSTKAAVRVLNDALNLQKLQSGAFEFVHKPFMLSDLMTFTLRMVQPQMRRKRIQLTESIEPMLHGVAVEGDFHRLQQVLVNYLNNAYKFTPPEGTIEVKMQHMWNSSKGGVNYICVRTSVFNTGDGIKFEDRSKIFQPWSQIRSGVQQQEQGSGLGLALCKAFVEKGHGGKVGFESEVGKGTQFYFSVPFRVCDSLPSVDLTKPIPAPTPMPPERSDHRPNHLTSFFQKTTSSPSLVNNNGNVAGYNNSNLLFQNTNNNSGPGLKHWSGQHSQTQKTQKATEMSPSIGIAGSGTPTAPTTPVMSVPVSPLSIAQSPLFKTRHRMSQLRQNNRHGSEAQQTNHTCGEEPGATEDVRAHMIDVLVVEDSMISRKLVTKTLGLLGLSFEQCVDGQEAVDRVKEMGVDYFAAILMDKEMPRMDGFEATAHIRELGFPGAIIGCTGNAMDDQVAEFLKIGADHVLGKPITQAVLKSTLEHFGVLKQNEDDADGDITPQVSRPSLRPTLGTRQTNVPSALVNNQPNVNDVSQA